MTTAEELARAVEYRKCCRNLPLRSFPTGSESFRQGRNPRSIGPDKKHRGLRMTALSEYFSNLPELEGRESTQSCSCGSGRGKPRPYRRTSCEKSGLEFEGLERDLLGGEEELAAEGGFGRAAVQGFFGGDARQLGVVVLLGKMG
jgi:hypothetical protein